jgi:hypothetical protein
MLFRAVLIKEAFDVLLNMQSNKKFKESSKDLDKTSSSL